MGKTRDLVQVRITRSWIDCELWNVKVNIMARVSNVIGCSQRLFWVPFSKRLVLLMKGVPVGVPFKVGVLVLHILEQRR